VVVSLAEKSGAELHLVHVWHTAAPFAPPSWFRDDAQRRLDEEVQHIQNAGGTVTETHLRKVTPPRRSSTSATSWRPT